MLHRLPNDGAFSGIGGIRGRYMGRYMGIGGVRDIGSIWIHAHNWVGTLRLISFHTQCI